MKDQIFRNIVDDFYDVPIMSNLARPHFVERMIALTLVPNWKLVSADWAGWDLERTDGVRAEVKQSAARQTWTDGPSMQGRPTRGVFDIRPRTGYWTEGGATWVPREGRLADIYILAWHPISEPDVADHRIPAQWRFHVVPEAELPVQKTISLPVVERHWPSVPIADLSGAVAAAAASLSIRKAAIS